MQWKIITTLCDLTNSKNWEFDILKHIVKNHWWVCDIYGTRDTWYWKKKYAITQDKKSRFDDTYIRIIDEQNDEVSEEDLFLN